MWVYNNFLLKEQFKRTVKIKKIVSRKVTLHEVVKTCKHNIKHLYKTFS